MFQLLLAVAVLAGLLVIISPIKRRQKLSRDLNSLKIQTVNMLNKVLKTDTSQLVDFHVPDVTCDGTMDHVMSPQELVELYHKNPSLYENLVACGYTRTVGLLHGFALWSSTSKSKDLKSFRYFVDCVNHVEWKDPNLFVDFHSPKSLIGKCVV
jgi:hypothetical protein